MIATCGSVSEAAEEMAGYVLHSGTRVSAAVGHAGREMEAAADALAHRILDKEKRGGGRAIPCRGVRRGAYGYRKPGGLLVAAGAVTRDG